MSETWRDSLRLSLNADLRDIIVQNESVRDEWLRDVQGQILQLDGMVKAMTRCGEAIANRSDSLNRNRDFEAMITLSEEIDARIANLVNEMDRLVSSE